MDEETLSGTQTPNPATPPKLDPRAPAKFTVIKHPEILRTWREAGALADDDNKDRSVVAIPLSLDASWATILEAVEAYTVKSEWLLCFEEAADLVAWRDAIHAARLDAKPPVPPEIFDLECASTTSNDAAARSRFGVFRCAGDCRGALKAVLRAVRDDEKAKPKRDACDAARRDALAGLEKVVAVVRKAYAEARVDLPPDVELEVPPPPPLSGGAIVDVWSAETFARDAAEVLEKFADVAEAAVAARRRRLVDDVSDAVRAGAWIGQASPSADLWQRNENAALAKDVALGRWPCTRDLATPGTLWVARRPCLYWAPNASVAGLLSVFGRPAAKDERHELRNLREVARVPSPVPLKKNAIRLAFRGDGDHDLVLTLNAPGASVAALMDLVEAAAGGRGCADEGGEVN
ncbi:hypothetical protein JL721_12126 [Aureococcus anophagefferens]|nr:hypothetical protein JL721_12126 [Aureococcus anophagefferens]